MMVKNGAYKAQGGHQISVTKPRTSAAGVRRSGVAILTAILIALPTWTGTPSAWAYSSKQEAPTPPTTQAPIQVMKLTDTRAHIGTANNSGAEYYLLDISKPEAPRIIAQAEIGETVTALQATPWGTFLGTATPQRDIFLYRPDARSSEKFLTLPGEGKIRSIQLIGDGLLIQCDAAEGQDNTFMVSLADPRNPKVERQLRRPKLRIPHQLRIPPQIAAIQPTHAKRLWQHHPGNADYAAVGLANDNNSFRLHRIQPEPLRFRDNNGNGQLELACVGDSNTFTGHRVWPPSWCKRVVKEVLNPAFSTRNYSVMGASIEIGWTEKSADTLLENALREEPDAVLFAIGTNDLPKLRPDRIAADVQNRIDKLKKLTARAEAKGAQTFVALLPPRYDGKEAPESRELFNQAIADNWTAEQVVDFGSGFSPADFEADGLHFNGRGHAKRTIRVAEFLQKETKRGEVH